MKPIVRVMMLAALLMSSSAMAISEVAPISPASEEALAAELEAMSAPLPTGTVGGAQIAPVAPAPMPAPVPTAPFSPQKPKQPEQPQARDIPLIETMNPASASADVTYITGGVGEDETQALQAVKADYNVYVMSASMNGAFTGDVRVVIFRLKGAEREEVLNVVAGPLLYVTLPAGNYVLDATLGSAKKSQKITISEKRKTAHVHLGWNVEATVTK